MAVPALVAFPDCVMACGLWKPTDRGRSETIRVRRERVLFGQGLKRPNKHRVRPSSRFGASAALAEPTPLRASRVTQPIGVRIVTNSSAAVG